MLAIETEIERKGSTIKEETNQKPIIKVDGLNFFYGDSQAFFLNFDFSFINK